MRFGKGALCFRFAIAIEDRTTEPKDDYRRGEDDHPKAKAQIGRQLPQRPPGAFLRCSFAIHVSQRIMPSRAPMHLARAERESDRGGALRDEPPSVYGVEPYLAKSLAML